MEHTFKIEKELKITTENIVDCVLYYAVCDFRRRDLRLIKTGWPGGWPVIFFAGQVSKIEKPSVNIV